MATLLGCDQLPQGVESNFFRTNHYRLHHCRELRLKEICLNMIVRKALWLQPILVHFVFVSAPSGKAHRQGWHRAERG